MPLIKPSSSLRAKDTRVLASLKQGKTLERFYRYEWVTLENLEPIVRLMHNLAEGPALNLCRQDEFTLQNNPNHANRPIYVINRRGRLWHLLKALDKLYEIHKYIPPAHFAPHVQSFHRVFCQPSFLLNSMESYHDAVEQAVADVRLEDTNRPGDRFVPPLCEPDNKLTFSEEEAQDCLENINGYLRHLIAVLKHKDVKRAQRSRQQQAEKHHRTLQHLFKKTLQIASPVLQVYLDLEGPDPEKANTLEVNYERRLKNENSRAYKQINEARKEFLKPRNHDPLFHGLISYAWKYRYSYNRGLTCMMVLFYDAERETQLYRLTHALGAHWESVAGEGSKYTSPITSINPVTQEQYFGLLEADNPDAKKGLEALARFMGLYQLYVKPAPPKHMHTFDTSRIPGVSSTKRKSRRKKPKKANQTKNEPPEDALPTQEKNQ